MTIWSRADIHIHTRYSDGHSSVAQVLEYADHIGLRVIAITDHDTIDGALEAQRMARGFDVEVIIGEEVSTTDGHLLVLFLTHALPPRRPASETIAAAHAQGALCIVAHPFDWLVSSFGTPLLRYCGGDHPIWPVDGVEAFNASLPLPGMNARAASVATTLGLPACGGSDAHHFSTVGLGYTLFPGTTANDLRQAIIHGEVRAGGRSWAAGHYAAVAGLRARRGLARAARAVTRPARVMSR
ncbi:PHP domain-containing protein [Roseiflexus sp.]|uniref:PHP domain-containing protein n=1 Tax=Roseiflexus sp. TaxID=2562120 RepID=UPI0021DE982D|nr:PHP domain-containing protein [Roseiflexus sp.]GIW02253.1 MAG: phosphotransferase [Roseiflexus sp.]